MKFFWKSGALAAAVVAAALAVPRPAGAQTPVVGVTFVPWTGDVLPERDGMVTVQNATSAPTVFLMVEFPAEDAAGCAECRVLDARCSGEIPPRHEWTVAVAGRAATVFALGPESETTSIFCAEMAGHPPGQCERYRGLLGTLDGASVPPVAVTARLTRRAGLGTAAEDLVGGLSMGDVAAYSGTHDYVATGLHIDTHDGFDSTLALQNAGTECITATLGLILTGDGQAGGAPEVQVPPGETVLFRPSSTWPHRDTGAVRVGASGPLAVLVATVGHDTAAAHGAEPERPVAQWFAPLAFQEERRAVDVEVLPGFWPGGETMVGALNLLPTEVPLDVRTQALGHAARPIIIRLPGLEQTVFQFGFGLALAGGPGWARMSAPPEAVIMSLEHVRSDTGGVRFAEQYSQRAWARVAGEVVRTIAFPELGGPAVGDGMELVPASPAAATTMTDTLEARLAISNLLDEPAVVAIEGSAQCGATGAITRTIDADSAVVLPVRQLPGVANGGNRALVHVIEGQVAASVDVVRPVQSEDGETPPQDFTSGYKGIALSDELPLAPVPAAELQAAPTEVVLSGPAYTATLAVSFVADGPRCLGFTAATDAEWLSVTPSAGALPATVLVKAMRPPADVATEAVVVITANVDGVANSPLFITVRLEPEDEGPRPIYLPHASVR